MGCLEQCPQILPLLRLVPLRSNPPSSTISSSQVKSSLFYDQLLPDKILPPYDQFGSGLVWLKISFPDQIRPLPPPLDSFQLLYPSSNSEVQAGLQRFRSYTFPIICRYIGSWNSAAYIYVYTIYHRLRIRHMFDQCRPFTCLSKFKH